MKTGILVFICFVASLAQAQTAIIAHKSHSGSSSGFFSDPNTNFGIPSPRLVQVIRLNDSVSVEVRNDYRGNHLYDTILKHPAYTNYNLNLDSMKQRAYYRNVEYINFKKSPKSAKPIPPGNQLIEDTKNNQSNELAPSPEQKQETAPKKKKRSALLFIFLGTGGGLLIFGFVRRLFTPHLTA